MKTQIFKKKNRQVVFFARMTVIILFICTVGSTFSIQAQSLDDAARDAVLQLKNSELGKRNDFDVILEIVNYYTNKTDQEARKIQSSLYTAIQSYFPRAKIVLLGESVGGVSAKAISVKGTYKSEGGKIVIELKAINQVDGHLITEAKSEYASKSVNYENLVVVMPLDAPDLSKSVISTLSHLLRSALTKTGKFNLISADIVDSVNADEIQSQYQCSREECSTIVAEQLNASQVITTKYSKLTDKVYFLTASLKDIKTGRTLKEEAIQHDGNIDTLPSKIEEVACKLADTCGQPQVSAPLPTPAVKPEPTPPVENKAEPQKDEEKEPELRSKLFVGGVIGGNISEIKIESGSSTGTGNVEIESASGYMAHWASQGGVGFGVTQVDLKIKDTETEFSQTIFQVDYTSTGIDSFLWGVGLGYVYSNIICDTCFYEPGSGFDVNLKLGYVGDSFGFAFILHQFNTTASQKYTLYNTDYEYKYSWVGTASLFSFIFAF